MDVYADMSTVLVSQGNIRIRQFSRRSEDFGLWIVSIGYFLCFKDLSNTIRMSADDVVLSQDNIEHRPLIAIQ